MQGTLSSNVAISVDTPARQRRRAIVATVLGNGLEWFDFTVYSFFAVIIAKLFFPTGNELTSLLLAVATFGVGFFMRPVGGMVLGVYADKVGRKAALSLTILLMAGGTALIGLAPTYDQIGLWAPVLIVVARLLQGFSAGGEMGTATAFLTEYAPAGKRAFYSSWIQSSIGFAVLLGAAVGTFVTSSLSGLENAVPDRHSDRTGRLFHSQPHGRNTGVQRSCRGGKKRFTARGSVPPLSA
jgi:MHS family proline/betaine transporter-like MFS transporter